MTVRAQGSGTATYLGMNGGATAPVSAANEGRQRYNTALQRFEFSENGGAYVAVVPSSLIVVANTAALSAYPLAGIANGTPAWVVSLRDWCMLEAASVEALSETCFATSAAGRWKRACLTHDHWQSQSAWHINQAAGLVDNDGLTPATAVPSHAEVDRRTGLKFNQTTDIVFDVNYTGDLMLVATRPWPLGDVNWRGGTPTVIYSGSVTAAQAWSPPATRGQITDAAIPVSWTASGLLQKRIVLTSGPNAGSWAWVQLDVGAKTCQHSVFFNPSTYANVDPSPGETFDVQELVVIAGTIYLSGSDIAGLFDVRVAPPPGASTTAWVFSGELQPIGCDFDGAAMDLTVEQAGLFASLACRFGCTLSADGPGPSAYSRNGSFHNRVSAMRGGLFGTTGHDVFQKLPAGPNPFIRGGLDIFAGSWLGMFDTAASVGYELQNGGYCTIDGEYWGDGNTFGHALSVQTGAGAGRYTVLPTIAGATVADVDLGGTHLAWAGLPAFNPAQFAGMVT